MKRKVLAQYDPGTLVSLDEMLLVHVGEDDETPLYRTPEAVGDNSVWVPGISSKGDVSGIFRLGELATVISSKELATTGSFFNPDYVTRLNVNYVITSTGASGWIDSSYLKLRKKLSNRRKKSDT